MKKIIYALFAILISNPAHAALNVFTCEPEWAALTQQLAGEQAHIYTATTALQDPHRVEARPSLIAKVRNGAPRLRVGKNKPRRLKVFPSWCSIEAFRI